MGLKAFITYNIVRVFILCISNWALKVERCASFLSSLFQFHFCLGSFFPNRVSYTQLLHYTNLKVIFVYLIGCEKCLVVNSELVLPTAGCAAPGLGCSWKVVADNDERILFISGTTYSGSLDDNGQVFVCFRHNH